MEKIGTFEELREKLSFDDIDDIEKLNIVIENINNIEDSRLDILRDIVFYDDLDEFDKIRLVYETLKL